MPVFFWVVIESGAWVVGYGAVQASAPAWILSERSGPPTARQLGVWTGLLVVPLVAILVALRFGISPSSVLVAGLALYGIAFAANSATHSYLVVAYSDRDKVALNVGFYYMANAAGRLVGTVLSGVVFEAGGSGQRGLEACLAVALGFALVSAACCIPLRVAERGKTVSAEAS